MIYLYCVSGYNYWELEMKNIVKLLAEVSVIVASLSGVSYSTVQYNRHLTAEMGTHLDDLALNKLEKTLGEHESFLTAAIGKKRYSLDVERRFLGVDSLMESFIDAEVSFENNKERLEKISGLFGRILSLKDKNQESLSSRDANLTLKNKELIKINECFEDSNRFCIAAMNALDDAEDIYLEITKLREMCGKLSKLSDDAAKKQVKIGSLYITISEKKYKQVYELYEEYARRSKEEFERGERYYKEMNTSYSNLADHFVDTSSL